MTTETTREQVLVLAESAKSMAEIAKHIGVSRQRVEQIVKQYPTIHTRFSGKSKYQCTECGSVVVGAYICGKNGLRRCQGCKAKHKRDADAWSQKFKHCTNCGTEKTKHKGNGLCQNCYRRLKYKNNPNFRQKIIENNKRFRRGLTRNKICDIMPV